MSKEESSEKARSLAEIKSWIERRIIELSEELKMLRQISSHIDEELAGLSFKRLDTMVERRAETVAEEPAQERPQLRVIRSRSGANLATLSYTDEEARFILSPEVELRRDDKPFSSFLLRKVLDAMVKADAERVEAGELEREKSLSYDIKYEDGMVREIIVRNYRDSSRLRELTNSVRWTLETVSSR